LPIRRCFEAAVTVEGPERSARHFRTLGCYLVGAGLDETSGSAMGPFALRVEAFLEAIRRDAARLRRSPRP